MGLATREAYGQALVELGKTNDKIVVLDADLSKSTKTADFKKAYPERFINVGIAEQNLMGISAGISYTGMIPFASSFAVFACGRGFEVIRNSICYPKLNVKIAATHAGITVGEDGGSHQSIEDIAIMNSLPNMTVIVPCDEEETKQVIKAAAEMNGPVYIRLGRLAANNVFDKNYKFEIGQGVKLQEGKQCSVITTGFITSEVAEAIADMNKIGYNIRHIHIPTIKPIDKKIIIEAAEETNFIMTFEEHSTIGGLGDVVCSVTAQSKPIKVFKYGMEDRFGESGKPEELLKKYKLDKDSIIKEIKKAIKKFN